MARFEKPTKEVDLIIPMMDENGSLAPSIVLRVYEDYQNSIITINYIPRDFSDNSDNIIEFGDQILAMFDADSPMRKKDLIFKSLPDPVTGAVAVLKHPRSGLN